MRLWIVLAFTLLGCAAAAPSQDGGSDSGLLADAGTAPDGGTDLDGGAGADGGHGDGGSENDGGSNLECTFNADCPSAERCECELALGCLCRTGARGSGKAGVDPCVDGNDCETALCVEGNGLYYCSGPCSSPADCGPNLPRCTYVTFLGEICVRDPNG